MKGKSFILTRCFVLSALILLMQVSVPVQAQTGRSVSVDVSDSQGPLAGVGVLVKGTSQGGVTDSKGKVTITGVNDKTVLVISYLGYAEKEETVGKRSSISVTLEEDAEMLDELVVVGFGVQKRESLTSSIAQISNKDIITTKSISTVNSLQGKVPGLLIRQSNSKPGQFNTTLNLRGYGTPMIVIDGVTRTNTTNIMQEMNPEDIESISVLKDASAMIYGIGAENGVILVTTKQGQPAATPTITFSTSLNFSSPMQENETEDWVSFMKWNNAMSDVAKMGHAYTEEEIAGYESGDPAYKYYDWVGNFYKGYAMSKTYNLTLNGGSDKIRYYLGLGYADDNPIINTDAIDYKRYNINANATVNLTRYLTAKFATTVKLSNTTNTGATNLDTNGNMFFYLLQTDPRIMPTLDSDSTKYSDVSEHYNMYAMTQKSVSGYQKSNGTTMQYTFSLDYNAPFLKGLKISGQGGYTFLYTRKDALVKQYDLYDYNTEAYSATINSDKYSETWTGNSRLYGKIQANYSKKIQKHDIGVMAAAEVSKNIQHSIGATRLYGATQSESFFTHDIINQGDATTATNSGTRGENMTGGYLARVNYNYAGKYFAEVMGRYDGTYIYAPGKRFGFFPTYSAAWRISEEPFFKQILPSVNNLKVRWSSGRTGSTQGSAYAYIGGYSSSGSWVFSEGSNYTGYDCTIIENTILTWADVYMKDFGVDFELGKGKFGGTFDWYRRDTKGISAKRTETLPDFYGVSLPSENLNAKMVTGLELSLHHSNKIGDFQYNLRTTATLSRSCDTYLESENTKTYSSAQNYWNSCTLNRWSNFSKSNGRYEWLGGQFESLEEVGDEPVMYGTNATQGGNKSIIVGTYKIEDKNGDGYITTDDYYYKWAASNPPFQFGISLTGSYRNFDFGMIFNGTPRNYKAVGLHRYAGFGYLYSLPTRFTEDCYHVANYGDDPWDPQTEWVAGYWPALKRVTGTGATGNCTYEANQPYTYINAAYLRLQSLELGYQFPGSLMKKMNLKSIRIYFNGGNLMTICNKLLKYADPEDADGAGGGYGITKTYNFGINIKF